MNKLLLYLVACLIASSSLFSQNSGVSINTNSAKADGSAMLDVSGTSTGVLINRMTTSQMNAIASPATGLLIYNSDCNSFYYNSGTPLNKSWIPIISSNNTISTPGNITGPVSVCASLTGIAYSVLPVTGATSYNWSLPAGAAITGGAGTNSITVNFGNTSVVGKICVSASNNCALSGQSCITVTVTAGTPFSAGIISGNSPVCPGTSATLNSSPSGGTGSYTYQWYLAGNPVPSATDATYITVPLTNPLVYTESFEGFSFPPVGWASHVINDLGISGGDKQSPYGPPFNWQRAAVAIPGYLESFFATTISPHTGQGMALYDSWDAAAGDEAILVSPSFSTVGNTNGTTVSFWMMQSYIPSSQQDYVNVWYSISPTQPTSTSGANLLGTVYDYTYLYEFGWTKITYTIPSGVSSPHVWLIFDAVSAFDVEMYIDDVSWQSYAPLSYVCAISSGCYTGTTGSYSISLTTPPAASVVPPSASICAGNTKALNASGGDTYKWSNGAATQSITVGYSNTYIVTVTSSSTSCSSTASSIVSVIPNVSLITPTGSAIPGPKNASIIWNWDYVDGASGYNWSTNSNFSGKISTPLNSETQNINIVCPGTYTAYLQAYTSCSTSQTATITLANNSGAPPAPTAGINSASQIAVLWTWKPLNGPVSYIWNTTGNPTDPNNVYIVGSSQYNQTGLKPNTTYTAYVFAYNACGISAPTVLNQRTKETTSYPSFICGSPLIDTRDNQTYGTVQIGTQCWMSNNLNYGEWILSGTSAEETGTQKYCWNDSIQNCNKYGGLYYWGESMDGISMGNINALGLACNGIAGGKGNVECSTPVKGICPSGWHIPSYYEWIELLMTTATDAGTDPFDYSYNYSIQQPSNASVYTNLTSNGFKLLLAGEGSGVSSGNFIRGPGSSMPLATFWSSSDMVSTNSSWYGWSVLFWPGMGYPEYLNSSGPIAAYGVTTIQQPSYVGWEYSVRCLLNWY